MTKFNPDLALAELGTTILPIVVAGIALLFFVVFKNPVLSLSVFFLGYLGLEDYNAGMVSLPVLVGFFVTGFIFTSNPLIQTVLVFLFVIANFSIKGIGGADIVCVGVLFALMPLPLWIVSMIASCFLGLSYSWLKKEDGIRFITFIAIGTTVCWSLSYFI